MTRKFKITYRAVLKRKYKITYNKNLEIEIEAYSKYDAKQHFYRLYPHAKIISIKEVIE